MRLTTILCPLAIAATWAFGSAARADDDANDRSRNAQGSQDEGSAIDKANSAADRAGAAANRAVVGEDQQRKNEEEARKHSQEAQGGGNANPSGASGDRRGNANPPPGSSGERRGSTNRQGDCDCERRGSTNRQPDSDRERGSTSRQPDSDADQVGRTAAGATSGIESGIRDVTRSTDTDAHYDPFAIEWNPLDVFVGALSFNLEWVPATHQAIVVTPRIVHTTADVSVNPGQTESQAFSGFGGEVGYRYYTGHRGMNGVFIGPSLIAGVFNGSLPGGDQAFTNFGIAGDVGLQQIFFDHLVLGGGVGVEYLSVSHDFHDLPTAPSTVASSGVKGRLLFAVGYGF
ncbi:MAG: hypothetical protein JOZ69_08130 [Myxococcales bacterium]|nr:hypothetical protein [Myxococcales bacterium]